jgi:penicillin amidase
MLKYLDTTKIGAEQLQAYDIVKNWDKFYAANSMGASIFNIWWFHFNEMVWKDKFEVKGTFLKEPSTDRTEKLLLTEPNSKWFDNTQTPEKETCADVVNKSFTIAIDSLEHKYGPRGPKWQWGVVKETFINHLASLPGFGTGKFSAGGRGGVINALRNNNGPSWRMVVQMGPTVKGYGVFPGGESGNPGSFFYNDMFKTWKDGKLNELLFLNSASEPSKRIKTTLTLMKK